MAKNLSDHVLKMTAQEASERLKSLNTELTNTLGSFLRNLPATKTSLLPIFEVKYDYGQLIVGPHFHKDKFSKICAPCVAPELCQHCRQLLDVFSGPRPLMIVLDGSCEEYNEYEQIFPRLVRRVPLQFIAKGSIIGISRFLNQIYLPDKPVRSIFGRLARHITAGARSIFLSASISNPRLIEQLLDRTPKQLSGLYFGDDYATIPSKELGKRLDGDHWRFFRLIAEIGAYQRQNQKWQTRLLLIPVDKLSFLLQEGGEVRKKQELMLALHAQYFLESRNSRSDHWRQLVVADSLSVRNTSLYARHTVHHLIEILRGEFPAFIPHDPALGDDFGPFTAFYEYLTENDVFDTRTMGSGFPLLLRPAHMDLEARPFVYYSFERPSLLQPTESMRSFRAFAAEVNDGLAHLVTTRPDLFDSAQWRFFISKGKPGGPQFKKRAGLSDEGETAFRVFQTDHQIHADFKPQIDHAVEKSWLRPNAPIFAESKWGFMAAFTRLSYR